MVVCRLDCLLAKFLVDEVTTFVLISSSGHSVHVQGNQRHTRDSMASPSICIFCLSDSGWPNTHDVHYQAKADGKWKMKDCLDGEIQCFCPIFSRLHLRPSIFVLYMSFFCTAVCSAKNRKNYQTNEQL